MLFSLISLYLTILGLGAMVEAAGPLNARQQDTLYRYGNRIEVPPTLQDPAKSNDGLYERQYTCGVGSHACSTGGCCSGPCCGDGCCPLGYTCHYVGNTPGCCPPARTCSSQISGCTSSSLVECASYDFCCPRGETCSLLNGNAHCSGSGGGGNDYTYTYTTKEYTSYTYFTEETTTTSRRTTTTPAFTFPTTTASSRTSTTSDPFGTFSAAAVSGASTASYLNNVGGALAAVMVALFVVS